MKNENEKISLITQREDTMSCNVACVNKCVNDKEIQKRKREVETEIWRLRLRNREEKQASQEQPSLSEITDSNKIISNSTSDNEIPGPSTTARDYT